VATNNACLHSELINGGFLNSFPRGITLKLADTQPKQMLAVSLAILEY
jgi:hypothetical protein